MGYKKPQKKTEYSKVIAVLKKVTTWLSVFVVFCTTYSLIIPAITMEKTSYCGKTYHEHIDSCYEKQLVCDENHEHTAECYERFLICDMSVHIHSLSCYSDTETDVETTSDRDETTAVQTIEGDSEKAAKKQNYNTEAADIMGYGQLVQETADPEDTAEKNCENTYIYENKEIKVTAACMEEGILPEGAELVVKTYDENDDTYATRLEEAQAVISESRNEDLEIRDFRLFDIHFENDGNVIEPDGTVNVQITMNDRFEEDLTGEVIHFADKETELMDAEVTEKKEETILDFDTESFSDYGIAFYEEGRKYTATKVNFSDLKNGDRIVLVTTDNNGNNKYLINGYNEAVPYTTGNNNTYSWSSDESVWWEYIRVTNNTYYLKNTVTGKYINPNNNAWFSDTPVALGYNTNNRYVQLSNNTGWRLVYNPQTINGVQAPFHGGTNTVTRIDFATESTEYRVWFDATCGGSSNYQGLMNQRFTTRTDSDGRQYVITPTADEVGTNTNNYKYKVVGWFDLYGHSYYKPGEKAYITSNTVFYADLVAATYDVGVSNGHINDLDTGYFINTEVFDYNELFNLYSTRLGNDASVNRNSHNENWTWSAMNTPAVASDKSMDFVFVDSAQNGIRSLTHWEDNSNRESSRRGNTFPGIVSPNIAKNRPDLIPRLFTKSTDDSDMVLGQHYIGRDNYLYQYDTNTGYYYFNSRFNSASYNQADQRFYVYDHAIKGTGAPSDENDLLMFNYAPPGSGALDVGNGSINYWFGFKSEIDFYLPDATGQGGNKVKDPNEQLQDMIFKFAGDDDIWVFVDGQPALDLGGVHHVTYGEINFSTGKVRTGEDADPSSIAKSEGIGLAPGQGRDKGTLNLGPGEHTLTVYYLERGGNRSNAIVYFNLVPRYSMEITKQDQEDQRHLSGAEFTVYLDEACTIPAQLWDTKEQYNKSNTAKSTFVADENGKVSCWGLNPKTTYYVKETKPAEGYLPVTTELIGVSLDQYGNASYFKVGDNNKDWDFVSKQDVDKLTHTISFTVQNEAKAISVDKQWFDTEGNSINNTVDKDEIRFKLYQVATTEKAPDTGNVTVTWNQYCYANDQYPSQGNLVGTLTHNDIPDGSVVTLKYTAYTNQGLDDISQDALPYIMVNNEKKYFIRSEHSKDYTVQFTANGNMTIYGNAHTWQFQKNDNTKLDMIYTPASAGGNAEPADPVTTLYGTYSISKANDWHWVEEDIPQTGRDSNGNKITYTYYVEEVAMENYETEYVNNEGISKGTITIKNTQTEVPTYELPETGGNGTLPYTIGGLMLAALSGVLLFGKKSQKGR